MTVSFDKASAFHDDESTLSVALCLTVATLVLAALTWVLFWSGWVVPVRAILAEDSPPCAFMLQALAEDAARVIYHRRRPVFGEWQLHGRFRSVGEDGQTLATGRYVDGRIHGQMRIYYDSGQLCSVYGFDHGRQQGPERIWDESGNLRFERNWEHNRKHGDEAYFGSEGERLLLLEWQHGKLARLVRYEDGEVSSVLTGEEAEGVWQEMILQEMEADRAREGG